MDKVGFHTTLCIHLDHEIPTAYWLKPILFVNFVCEWRLHCIGMLIFPIGVILGLHKTRLKDKAGHKHLGETSLSQMVLVIHAQGFWTFQAFRIQEWRFLGLSLAPEFGLNWASE